MADGRADAGVSTALAAQRYGLGTLAEGVVDEPNARTRFVLVGRPGRRRRAPGPTAPRWCCGSTTRPARWWRRMTEFGIRDIDLTRIESRPTRTELGTYMFFLDCVGHIDDSAVAEALKALAPALCRRALPRFVADGIGDRRDAAATRRGRPVAGPTS